MMQVDASPGFRDPENPKMPLYEYICDACEKMTEALRRMDDADSPLVCEHCGHQETRRAQSVFSPASGQSGLPMAPPSPCGRCGDPAGSCGL